MLPVNDSRIVGICNKHTAFHMYTECITMFFLLIFFKLRSGEKRYNISHSSKAIDRLSAICIMCLMFIGLLKWVQAHDKYHICNIKKHFVCRHPVFSDPHIFENAEL